MSDNKKIRWSNVWVIGASSGIGLELAKQLSSLCENITVSARNLNKLEVESAAFENMRALQLDITKKDQIKEVASKIGRDCGPIDLVVISSGVWRPSKLPNLDVEAFCESIDVNYLGVVRVIDAVGPQMVERQSGQIAIIASIAGYRGLPNAAAYAPTKAALINLAECIYPQFKRTGVDISVVNPGFVETPMTSVNEFTMPFIQTPERAAAKIVIGLKRKDYEIAFPKRLTIILKILRILPNRIFFWLVNRYVLR